VLSAVPPAPAERKELVLKVFGGLAAHQTSRCESDCVTRVNYTTYAVALSNTHLPAAAWYFLFYLYFVFALCERKDEIQKKEK
jgi:hypothetical protein